MLFFFAEVYGGGAVDRPGWSNLSYASDCAQVSHGAMGVSLDLVYSMPPCGALHEDPEGVVQ
jgi:hypothetical protein